MPRTISTYFDLRAENYEYNPEYFCEEAEISTTKRNKNFLERPN